MKALVVMFALAACSEDRVLSEPCDGCAVSLHPVGIADPASPDFHGTLLRDANWDFPACQKCHGEDYQGGTSGKSCFACHEQGPTACVTCHRADKESSSHAVHRGAKFDCVECHIKPASWDAPGHIVDDSPPAEVTFGMLASAGGTPSWDGQRCSNVYCHGDTRPTAGGAMTKPLWNATPVGGCTNCHGAPPPSHARSDCAACHPANAPHVDGAVQIGRTNGCDGCHGNAGNAAPPVDLEGNMFTTAIGVGAHQAHLQGPSQLRAPLPCETCHAVPATLTAVGHLDAAPADVLSVLGWNRDTQTCTTWCHGNAQPRWTSSGEVVCGSCHGVPPATASHSPTMTIASCVNCHAKTVNAFGNILVSGGQHMDGDVDGN